MFVSNVHLILLSAALVGLPAGASALDITPSSETAPGLAVDGVPTAVDLTHGGHRYSLQLWGSGVRTQLMFKVYESAVYAEAGADSKHPFQSLLEPTSVKHMRLVFLRDTTGPKVRTTVESGFTQAHGMDHKFKEPLDTLLEYLQDGMLAGQVLSLTWIPGDGLFIQVEGREALRIPSDDFAQAVLTVWFGPKPVNNKLKQDMVRLLPRDPH